MLRILFWPLTLFVNLTRLILDLTGKALGFFLGLVLVVLGVVLCLTLIGAIIGVPLCLLGGGMMLRCFW